MLLKNLQKLRGCPKKQQQKKKRFEEVIFWTLMHAYKVPISASNRMNGEDLHCSIEQFSADATVVSLKLWL